MNHPPGGTSSRRSSRCVWVGARSIAAVNRSCASASMTGPTCRHRGRMTDDHLGARSTSRSNNESKMRSATITRDAAEHFWPANPNAEVTIAGDGLVGIGVLVDDDRVLAAHLGDDPLHVSLPRFGAGPPLR